MPTARKSIAQNHVPSTASLQLMKTFSQMTNDCIRVGLREDVSTLKKLSKLCYDDLKQYEDPSCYRLCAISKAAGILAARKKSIKRGFPTKNPYVSRLVLISCYGFKIANGRLLIPLGEGEHEAIPLNSHTLEVLSSEPALRVRSFTLTETSLSLCVSKEVNQMIDLQGADGIDRNLRNVTVGDEERVTYYDVSKLVSIAENSSMIVASFKRDDVRVRRRIASKYGRRRKHRTESILHLVSKDVVENAKARGHAVVFEEVKGIRRLYRKGNGQGRGYRRRMNSWPFGELKRQVEYKAAWEGVPVITLTRSETRGTTFDCPRCGERLQSAARGDDEHHRQLWCNRCGKWTDRDLVAVLNISRRGWVRFAQSKGGASEAVRGNPGHEGGPVILRVDASKLGVRCEPKT